MPVACCTARQVMQAVRTYKHVGAQHTSSATMGEETAVKGAILFNVLKPYRRRLLRNPDVSMIIKRQAVSTLIVSKGLFQCGTWPGLTRMEMNRFAATTMKLYRMLLPVQDYVSEKVLTEVEVLQRFGLLHPLGLLKFSRLRTLFRTIR